MFEYIINILGREYKMKFFMEKKEYQAAVDTKDSVGETNDHKKEIYVYVQVFGTGSKRNNKDVFFTSRVELIVWHELGHAVEEWSPSSTIEGEFTSTKFEVVPTLIHQVNSILEDLEPKANKYIKENYNKKKNG